MDNVTTSQPTGQNPDEEENRRTGKHVETKHVNNVERRDAETKPAETSDEDDLTAAAEKSVRDQHGIGPDSPSWQPLVADAKKQIKGITEANKDM